MTTTAPAISGPPPPRYFDPSSWKLLSQGAEARVWHVPSYVSLDGKPVPAVCKERFPKSYRHPSLDAGITKGRTKGEARCLVRCRRGGVPCPAVLGVDLDAAPGGDAGGDGDGGEGGAAAAESRSSCCIFLEYVQGCTVREYFDVRSDHSGGRDGEDDEDEDGGDGDVPARKRPRRAASPPTNGGGGGEADAPGGGGAAPTKAKMTVVDAQSLAVALRMGEVVAAMHNAGVIHGDLTTSNVMLRNPPPVRPAGAPEEGGEEEDGWKPRLCLIDLGLAGTAGGRGTTHEEKAVDLYVLERAFSATHPGSRRLVDEVLRAYKAKGKNSDSVLQRLAQVRQRGRKRECFG